VKFIPWYKLFFKRAFVGPAQLALQEVSGRVLDVGCGDGIITRTLKKSSPHLRFFGIDINKNQIAKAISENSDIRYTVASGEKLPFAKDHFSAVVCFEVLEHVDRIDKVVHEIGRVLKKGGVFYLTTPLEGDTSNLYGLLNKFAHYDTHKGLFGHINKNTLEGISATLMTNRFKIVKQTFCSHYANQLYMIVTHFVQSKTRKLDILIKPLDLMIAFVTGVESEVLRHFRGGLDVQITAVKQ